MKHHFAILAVAALMVPTADAQTPRFGHCDLDSIVRSMPARDSAEMSVRARAIELDRRLKAMQTEFTTRLEEYRATSATMPVSTRDAEETELQDMQERITQAQQRAEEELDALHDEMMVPIMKRVEAALKAVATERGYMYIIDTGSGVVLYTDNSGDVTAFVRAKLGLK